MPAFAAFLEQSRDLNHMICVVSDAAFLKVESAGGVDEGAENFSRNGLETLQMRKQ